MFSAAITLSWRFLVWSVICGLVLSLSSCRRQVTSFPRSIQPGETVYFVPTAAKMIALTFDDGPNGAATEQILDSLKQFHASATFFLIGTNITYYPEIARRIAREGHMIGNHTFSHPRFDHISVRDISQEINAGADAIADVTGVVPAWFRPPFGINGVGLQNVCRAQGLTIAGWSGHAGDWNPRSAVEIAERMITQTTPGDILLLHDGRETRHGVNRQSTVDAVYLILERLTREGFQFVTIAELLQHAGPPLAEFANNVRLLGLHVQDKPVHPGGALYIRYFWDVPAEWNPKSIFGFMHFKHADGFRFQADHTIPARGDVRDLVPERVLVIPSNALPGVYQGSIGLFDPAHPDIRHRVPVHASILSHRKRTVVLPGLLKISEKMLKLEKREKQKTDETFNND